MCGIAGLLVGPGNDRRQGIDGIAALMADAIRHRGPDSGGVWCDLERGVALGHRRLSIIDLSPSGNQPMISATGRYVIVYNGEIYNFERLRAKLRESRVPGDQYRGHSDTEVMLRAFDAWGIEGALSQLNGMFAFAVWDRANDQLVLARDRLGEKPLYYGWSGNSFLFASELKALRASPGFRAEIDRNALALYTRFGYVPSGHSIYAGIRKLPAGMFVEVSRASTNDTLSPKSYWSAEKIARNGVADPLAFSESEATKALTDLLMDAVGLRMVSDVPLGAFLSGGIDSSLVVAAMQRQSTRPVKTFSIGFKEPEYNEAHHARKVAEHLGTDHTELYLSSADAIAVIPALPDIYDEPFADSSQIPTTLVSRLARQSVTVALSGDGGDEVFGGYNRYFRGPAIWAGVKRLPLGARRVGARLLRAPSAETWGRIGASLRPVVGRYASNYGFGEVMQKVASVLELKDFDQFYLRSVVHWSNAEKLLVNESPADSPLPGPVFENVIDRMMLLDLVTYLPDDILTKLDRASMHVSLEARVPLLDHRVVEFAWRLPQSMKIRGAIGKHLLRNVLYEFVPASFFDRPKSGFVIPVNDWLRTSLREWAEALLSENRLRSDGFFRPETVRRAWSEHLAGRGGHGAKLWTVLMFQAWLERERLFA